MTTSIIINLIGASVGLVLVFVFGYFEPNRFHFMKNVIQKKRGGLKLFWEYCIWIFCQQSFFFSFCVCI